MSATVIPLALHRPCKPARDLVKWEAGDGTVFLTVVDGDGHTVEVAMSLDELDKHVQAALDARDVAEAISRG